MPNRVLRCRHLQERCSPNWDAPWTSARRNTWTHCVQTATTCSLSATPRARRTSLSRKQHSPIGQPCFKLVLPYVMWLQLVFHPVGQWVKQQDIQAHSLNGDNGSPATDHSLPGLPCILQCFSGCILLRLLSPPLPHYNHLMWSNVHPLCEWSFKCFMQ